MAYFLILGIISIEETKNGQIKCPFNTLKEINMETKPEYVYQTSIRLKNFNLSVMDWIETFIPITKHEQMYNNFRI